MSDFLENVQESLIFPILHCLPATMMFSYSCLVTLLIISHWIFFVVFVA